MVYLASLSDSLKFPDISLLRLVDRLRDVRYGGLRSAPGVLRSAPGRFSDLPWEGLEIFSISKQRHSKASCEHYISRRFPVPGLPPKVSTERYPNAAQTQRFWPRVDTALQNCYGVMKLVRKILGPFPFHTPHVSTSPTELLWSLGRTLNILNAPSMY